MSQAHLDTYMPLLEKALGTDEVTDLRGEVLRVIGPDDHPITLTYRLSDFSIQYTLFDDGRYVQSFRDLGRAQVVAHALSMVFATQRTHIAYRAHRVCDLNHIATELHTGRARALAVEAHRQMMRRRR